MADLVSSGERNIHVAGKPTVGAMRNAGCEAARGEVIAHFDDDDFSAPGRLADQIERMAASGAAVTGYGSMRFTDGISWWRYSAPPNYALGTSLCHRRDWWLTHRFPEVQVGEDNSFVTQAAARRVLVTAEAGDMQWATIHEGNTSPRYTKGDSWTRL